LPKLREIISSLRKRLCAKTKDCNSDRLRLAPAFRIINQQGATIAQLNAELEKLKDSLKSAPLGLSEPAVPLITADDIAHLLLKELVDLMDQDPHARRYSKMMCDFASGLHVISPKAYDFACDTLPFPAVSTVLRRAEPEQIYVKEALGEKGDIPLSKYLQDYSAMEKIPEEQMVPATLAFDATSVSLTGVNQPWKTGSSFTFMLLSLDHRLPDAVLKYVKHPQGHIDLAILDLRDELLGIVKQNGFLCSFIATDGDNGVEGVTK
jgi:hypothetical protein